MAQHCQISSILRSAPGTKMTSAEPEGALAWPYGGWCWVDKTGAALGSSVVPNSHPLEEQWSSNRSADMSSSRRVSVS